jgi:hypothetical protein
VHHVCGETLSFHHKRHQIGTTNHHILTNLKSLAVHAVSPKLVSVCISLVTGNLTGEIANFGLNSGAFSALKPQTCRYLRTARILPGGLQNRE